MPGAIQFMWPSTITYTIYQFYPLENTKIIAKRLRKGYFFGGMNLLGGEFSWPHDLTFGFVNIRSTASQKSQDAGQLILAARVTVPSSKRR